MPTALPKPVNRRRGWIAIVHPAAAVTSFYGWATTATGKSTTPTAVVKTGLSAGAYGWVSTAVGEHGAAGLSSRLTATLPFILGTPDPMGQTSGSYGFASTAHGGTAPTSTLPLTLPFVTDS